MLQKYRWGKSKVTVEFILLLLLIIIFHMHNCEPTFAPEDACTRVFIAALREGGNGWKQCRCPSLGDWTGKSQHWPTV